MEQITVCAPSSGPPGRPIWTTDNEKYGHDLTGGSEFTEFGGTSSAVPLVAGIAGLVLSANPGLPAQEVRKIIESTADKIHDPDFPHPWCGAGKVNAYKAVKEAQELMGKSVTPKQRDFGKIPVDVLTVLGPGRSIPGSVLSALESPEQGDVLIEHYRVRGSSPAPGRLMPMLAALDSPGPLTMQPMTARVRSSTPT